MIAAVYVDEIEIDCGCGEELEDGLEDGRSERQRQMARSGWCDAHDVDHGASFFALGHLAAKDLGDPFMAAAAAGAGPAAVRDLTCGGRSVPDRATNAAVGDAIAVTDEHRTSLAPVLSSLSLPCLPTGAVLIAPVVWGRWRGGASLETARS